MDIFGAVQLKFFSYFSAFILLLLSCNTVHEEEVSLLEPLEEIRPEIFSHTDSLYLSGEFLTVKNSLLSLFGTDSLLRDEVLFRLLGLYHSRAKENDFIVLLDSLEREGFGPFSGWKISTLDLAGTPGKALTLVPSSHQSLYAWLSWEADSLRSKIDISDDPADAFVLARTAEPGTISPRELQFLARYEALFPSVRDVLINELQTSAYPSGSWVPEILNSMTRTPAVELLLVERQASADSGSFRYWDDVMSRCDVACAVAVEEVLQRYSNEYSPRWDIVDCLMQSGAVDLAIEYSSKGDSLHRMGTDMAVLLYLKRYDELIQLTGDTGNDAPDSIRARAALFRARALEGSGNRGSIYYPAYLRFAEEFPFHPQAREAAYNAGKYYDCEQDWNNAAVAYLTSLGTSGSWGGDERANWRGGFSLYMSGRFIEAESLWARACEEWPAGYWRDEMLFWRARLAGELGRVNLRDSLLAAAAHDHPWEFYGMLAAKEPGIQGNIRFPVPEVRLMEDSACSLAVELTAAGFGVPAVEMLSEGSFGAPYARAPALSLMGRHGEALRILRGIDVDLRESSDEILPDSLLCFYFPAPYRDLAMSSTDSLELDANVLQGIMREESYFDRWVVSNAGAIGVIQLMPGTAFDVARWYGLEFLEEDDFYNPALSVPYGALYINRQQGSFNGEIPLFLAAYNAGPGNAVRWVNMHGWNPDDPELYIEQITYRETRLYVKKVLRSAWIYERR